MSKINDILIIRLSSLGDIILSTHLPRILKSVAGKSVFSADLEIDLVVSKLFKDIYFNNPRLRKLFLYDKTWNSTQIKEFKEFILDMTGKKYDLIIDLQGNFRSLEFRYGLGRIIRTVSKRYLHKLSLVQFKKSPFKNKKIPDVYLDSIKDFKAVNDGKGLEIWIRSDLERGIYDPSGGKLKGSDIVIAPGAKHFTKRWLAEKYAELISYLLKNFNKNVILTGSKEEEETCKFITQRVEDNQRIKDLCGKTSIIETVELIDKAALVICNDSAAMHIAAARKVPVVAIFGSTISEFGFEPYGTKYDIAEIELSCRPCTHIGRSQCPKGHFNCMQQIDVKDVYDKAARFLSN